MNNFKKNSLYSEFKKRFGSFNEENIETAAFSDPAFLKEIITDETISIVGRSYALYALSLRLCESNFEFIKGFAYHSSPLMQEAALMSLFVYFDKEEGKHLEVLDFFWGLMSSDLPVGVRSKLEEIINFSK